MGEPDPTSASVDMPVLTYEPNPKAQTHPESRSAWVHLPA
jgi:hypothetical protein